jgi:hypothetical protein
MKPGRVKRAFGVDWFTLLFEFPRAACASHSRGLIQRCDESHSGLRVFFGLRVAASYSSSQSVSELPLYPLELDTESFKVDNRSPLVLTSAITLSWAALILSSCSGIDFYFVAPGRLISQHGPTAH